ncbi:MAG: hypothetical protein IJY22_01375 [Clostridia bacterium]|nr:hypothetical protein [Clostridia bacterium]
MGCFVISRTPAGDRFMLQSDAGRTLVTSRDYATLDACKKGICSLVYYAPIVPVVDTSAGEYGPNPKFEITADDSGALYYNMKSANGKSVVEDGPFATKKACLRAISMLRAGVQNAAVFFARPGGFDRLTVGGMVQDAPGAYAAKMPPVQESASTENADATAAKEPKTEAVAPVKEPLPTVKVARRIPLSEGQRPTAPKAAPKPREPQKPAVSKSLFSRLFKR